MPIYEPKTREWGGGEGGVLASVLPGIGVQTSATRGKRAGVAKLGMVPHQTHLLLGISRPELMRNQDAIHNSSSSRMARGEASHDFATSTRKILSNPLPGTAGEQQHCGGNLERLLLLHIAAPALLP